MNSVRNALSDVLQNEKALTLLEKCLSNISDINIMNNQSSKTENNYLRT